MKKYIKLWFLLLLLGCSDDFCYCEGGITLSIYNGTNTQYNDSVKLYIGAIKDDNFIVTDSIIFMSVIIKPKEESEYSINNLPLDTSDWRPSLEKIEKESKIGGFYIEMGNLKHFFNQFSFPSPKLEGVTLGIRIENTGFTTVSNIIEKQDFEIVK